MVAIEVGSSASTDEPGGQPVDLDDGDCPVEGDDRRRHDGVELVVESEDCRLGVAAV